MKKSLLLIALLAGTAYAEPTKEETWDYIRRNLTSSIGTDSRFGGSYYKYSFDKSSCVFQKVTEDKNGNHSIFTTYTINLADLDPNEVKAITPSSSDPWIIMGCRERKNCVHTKSSNPSDNRNDYNGYEDGLSLDSDVPERVAKAFSHLIRLCGGKPELF